MLKKTPKQKTIFFAAGSGDIGKTFDYWLEGKDDPQITSKTYSGQFYSVCRELGFKGVAIAYNPSTYDRTEEGIRVRHIPKPKLPQRGALYHIREILYGLRIIYEAIKAKADYVVIVDGTTHWFLLYTLTLMGKKIIPSFFFVLWAEAHTFTGIKRTLLTWDVKFIKKKPLDILVVSKEVQVQIEKIAKQKVPCTLFFCNYKRDLFAGMSLKEKANRPTKVLYVGRIETSKGVFDLIKLAENFKNKGKEIVFDVCGTGSQLDNLKKAVHEKELSPFVNILGHCNHSEIKKRFNDTDIVIVPTRSDFAEGFNQVVTEGILSRRPVVTSSACNALSLLREACVEVPVNDVAAYEVAILDLQNNDNLYREKVRACDALQEHFYNENLGWKAQSLAIVRKAEK